MTVFQSVHGGGCCGAAHLYSFGSGFSEQQLATIKNQLLNHNDGTPQPGSRHIKLVEVVLTSDQMVTWQKPLEELGFKVVIQWTNPNTHRVLSMMVRTKETVLEQNARVAEAAAKQKEEEDARLAAIEAERKAELAAAKPVTPPVAKAPVRRAVKTSVPKPVARRSRVSTKRDPA